jgi:hypothetical protein
VTFRTGIATGTRAACKDGQVRFVFTLSVSDFAELKRVAVKNHRTIAAEIRMRIEASLRSAERAA